MGKANCKMLLIALLRDEGRQGPPHHTTNEDVVSLFAEAEILETENDLTKVAHLGKLVQNIYFFTL